MFRMDFAFSPKVMDLRERLLAFMDEHIYPNEKTYREQQAAAKDRWQPVPIVEQLKPLAREAGLWNLFLPHSEYGAASPIWNMRPWRKSWVACNGVPKFSIVRRPIPVIWKPSCFTAQRSKSGNGCCRSWKAKFVPLFA